MKSLLGGLLIATGAVVVAVGVLAGLEVLLQDSTRRRTTRRAGSEKKDVIPSSVDVLVPTPAMAATLIPKNDSERNFSIKRTKSEVGYVYWILEGYGKYKCFILCDSWDEAVAQAKVKLAEVDAAQVVTTIA